MGNPVVSPRSSMTKEMANSITGGPLNLQPIRIENLQTAIAQIQEKFLLASRYAKAIMKNQDPGMRIAYAAVLRPRQNIYSRALEDFLSSPEIKSISTSAYDGTVGSKITVRAVDDFRVSSVSVEIHTANGALLEKGNAEPTSNGIDWIYSVTQVNNPRAGSKIIVVATDVPGNAGTKEQVL